MRVGMDRGGVRVGICVDVKRGHKDFAREAGGRKCIFCDAITLSITFSTPALFVLRERFSTR